MGSAIAFEKLTSLGSRHGKLRPRTYPVGSILTFLLTSLDQRLPLSAVQGHLCSSNYFSKIACLSSLVKALGQDLNLFLPAPKNPPLELSRVCTYLLACFSFFPYLSEITLVIWFVIRIGPNGCESMEFHDSGLLRFKQVSDMGIIHPLYKSTVGGRRNEDLVITGNNQPVILQQGSTKLSVGKNKTSITSDLGMEFVDPRTQNTLFSTDYEKHEFHLPKGVKTLNVQKASTERITSSASSDLKINVDGHITVRGNEGVFIMGKTIDFRTGGNIVLKAENSIVLNGSVMVTPSRLPTATGELMYDDGTERYKLCMCADGTLFRVLVESRNMGCLTSVNPCSSIY